MRITGTHGSNSYTKVSISADPFNPIDGSIIPPTITFLAALLHIGCRVPQGNGGYRTWMNMDNTDSKGYGMYISSISDNIYLGLKKVGSTQDDYQVIVLCGEMLLH